MNRVVGKGSDLDGHTKRSPAGVGGRDPMIKGVVNIDGEVEHSAGSQDTNDLLQDSARIFGMIDDIIA